MPLLPSCKGGNDTKVENAGVGIGMGWADAGAPLIKIEKLSIVYVPLTEKNRSSAQVPFSV